jgi:hypothetical protein
MTQRLVTVSELVHQHMAGARSAPEVPDVHVQAPISTAVFIISDCLVTIVWVSANCQGEGPDIAIRSYKHRRNKFSSEHPRQLGYRLTVSIGYSRHVVIN